MSYKHIFSKCFFIQSPFFIFNSGPWALTELYLPWPVPTNKVRHHQLYYTYRDQQEYRNEMWWFTDTTKWEIGLFFTSCFSFIMTSMLIFKFCFLLAWIYLTFLTLFAPIALSKKFLHHITIAEYLKFGNFANFSQKPPSAISAFFNLLCCLSFIFFSVLFLSWLVFNP